MAWQLYVLIFPNGKRYFGITSRTLHLRWRGHRKEARLKPHNPVHRAIAKYGPDAVQVIALMTGSEAEICQAEIKAIAEHQTTDERFGYNLALGGRIAPSSAPAVRKKISESRTGQRWTDEDREKMSLARRGIPKSAEHRAKIGAANRGKKRSAEACAKPRGTFKGRKHSPETLLKMGEAQTLRFARERAARESIRDLSVGRSVAAELR